MEKSKHFKVCADMCAGFFTINNLLKRFLEILGMRRDVCLVEEHKQKTSIFGVCADVCASTTVAKTSQQWDL